jgi:hypothetical protein
LLSFENLQDALEAVAREEEVREEASSSAALVATLPSLEPALNSVKVVDVKVTLTLWCRSKNRRVRRRPTISSHTLRLVQQPTKPAMDIDVDAMAVPVGDLVAQH